MCRKSAILSHTKQNSYQAPKNWETGLHNLEDKSWLAKPKLDQQDRIKTSPQPDYVINLKAFLDLIINLWVIRGCFIFILQVIS